jgi:hypothetical protein
VTLAVVAAEPPPLQAHPFAVPRIRPPNASLHGLRAPPVCVA